MSTADGPAEHEPQTGGAPALELRGVTKRYGSVVACDNVDLVLRRGEIHGLLGENGAGKSTLMKIVFGLTVPDGGTMKINGDRCQITSPAQAASFGVGMVHQHYSLVDALTVWENVALGEQGALDPSLTRDRVADISERYGLDVDPGAFVRDLTAGLRQRVEIIKCLRHEPRIIILDEPTAVLTLTESEQLFEVLARGVRTEGWAVVLVSHKLEEIVRATHRVTIMRHGRVVGRSETSETDAPSLASEMVGRPVTLRVGSAAIGALRLGATQESPESDAPAQTKLMLEVSEAAAIGADGATLLDNLSLKVGAGEIVGVAGVEGNGQGPLTDLLSSILRLDGGRVVIEGIEIPTGVAGAMAKARIAVIPADRHDTGCIPTMTVAENLLLSEMSSFARRGVIQRDQVKRAATAMITEFGIATPSPETPLAQLSGGNQQRVVLAQALASNPKVLVADQPSRGLDVGAVEYIGKRLRAVADKGIGVLLVSTDLGEILALSDRIVAIYRGRIIGEMSRAEVDIEQLGLLIGGVSTNEETDAAS